jgi:hypothetical protein
MFCDGILRSAFGRRPSQAVERAMRQLMVEEAVAERLKARPSGWRTRLQEWLAGLHLRPAYALALVLALIGGTVSLSYFWHSRQSDRGPTGSVCRLSDALDARWASNSLAPRVNDSLNAGRLSLASGVVELTFNSNAKVAIEGPAEFELTGVNSMVLNSGKIATDVPRRAHGFSVNTPTAHIVDLGTRFGAIIGDDKSSEVDVFQGKIKLNPLSAPDSPADGYQLTQGMAMVVDQHGAVAAKALSEAAFPQPNISTLTRPQNCGFDVSARAALGGIPVDFGYWSGPSYQLCGTILGVNPASGPGMLQFLDNPSGPIADSEVWQIVDMHPYKKYFASGNAEIDYSAMFNRVAGDAHTARKFGLTLAAYQGAPTDAKSLWENRRIAALVLADRELITDDDPATWEKAAVTAKLPPETDFVIVEIRAIAPPDAVAGTSPFNGHFADLTDLKIRTHMRPSTLTINR